MLSLRRSTARAFPPPLSYMIQGQQALCETVVTTAYLSQLGAEMSVGLQVNVPKTVLQLFSQGRPDVAQQSS